MAKLTPAPAPNQAQHGGAPLSFHKFVEFVKVGTDEERIVEGYFSAEVLDDQNQLVTFGAIENALPDYLRWSNLRAMHQPIAAGTVLEVRPDLDNRRWWLSARIVDDDSWTKVKAGVYKGFSIGGSTLPGGIEQARTQDGQAYQKLTHIKLKEISVVDRPACEEAIITLWKGSNLPTMNEQEQEQHTQGDQVVEVAATQNQEEVAATQALPVAKAAGKAPDPKEVVAALQTLRNTYELGMNYDAAQMLTSAISNVLNASQDQQMDEEGGGDEEGAESDDEQDESDGGAAADTGTGVLMMEGDEDEEDGNNAGSDGAGADAGATTTPPPAGSARPDPTLPTSNAKKKPVAQIEMAAKILDLSKSGRKIASENMSHLKAAHDHLSAIGKGAGISFCKDDGDDDGGGDSGGDDGGGDDDGGGGGDDVESSARATDLKKASVVAEQEKIAKSVFATEFEKLEKTITDSLAALTARLEVIERQPANPGSGPVVSSAGAGAGTVEKSVGTSNGQSAQAQPTGIDAQIAATEAAITSASSDIAKASLQEHLTTLQIKKAQTNPVPFHGFGWRP